MRHAVPLQKLLRPAQLAANLAHPANERAYAPFSKDPILVFIISMHAYLAYNSGKLLIRPAQECHFSKTLFSFKNQNFKNLQYHLFNYG